MEYLTSRLGISLSQIGDPLFNVDDDLAAVETEFLLVHDIYISEQNHLAIALPTPSRAIENVGGYHRHMSLYWIEKFGGVGMTRSFPQDLDSQGLDNTPTRDYNSLIHLTAVPLALQVFLAANDEQSLKFAKERGFKLRDWFLSESRILRDGEICCILDADEKSSSAAIQGFAKTFHFTVTAVLPFRQSIVDDNTAICVLGCVPDYATTSGECCNTVVRHSEQEFENDNIVLDASFLANTVLLVGGCGDAIANTSISGSLLALQCPRLSRISNLTSLVLRASAHDLNVAGIFDNEWALAFASGGTRVVRARMCSSSRGVFGASPLLLHNLNRGAPCENGVGLRVGSMTPDMFPLPTAQIVSLSRVLSPECEQPFRGLVLHKLKSFKHCNDGVVKTGDLMCIVFASDDARILSPSNTQLEQDLVDEVLDALQLKRPWEKECVIEPIMTYHKVTNIVQQDLVGSAESTEKIYLAAKSGELGSLVNPITTQIPQVGMTRSYIPLPDPGWNSPDPTQRLMELITPFVRGATTNSKDLVPSFLVHGTRGVGKRFAAQLAAKRLGMHFCEIDCYALLDDALVKAQRKLKDLMERASRHKPCILFLNHVESLCQAHPNIDRNAGAALVNTLRHGLEFLKGDIVPDNYPLVTIASANSTDSLTDPVADLFKHKLGVEMPHEGARCMILKDLFRDSLSPSRPAFTSLARDTAALMAADLQHISHEAKLLAIQERFSSPRFRPQPIQGGVVIETSDLASSIAHTRRSSAQGIGAPTIPVVSWDDVGGLLSVKNDILDTISLPLENPALFTTGMKKRSGILLHGPPGTGKTMLAKAVATSCSLNFLSVKGPELLNMYIGESEANVRRIFQRARDATPCIIFFDELDSVAPARGKQGDSGGVMDRLVSQLLSELDGLTGGPGPADVFVIGATNRPDLLDPALLRPGRFDKLLYLGISETHEEQAKIISALTRNFPVSSDFDALQLARQCPLHYSGADFYALCSDALLEAMSRKANDVDSQLENVQSVRSHRHITAQTFLAKYASTEDMDIHVCATDFATALARLVPSISPLEMEYYREAQLRFTTGAR